MTSTCNMHETALIAKNEFVTSRQNILVWLPLNHIHTRVVGIYMCDKIKHRFKIIIIHMYYYISYLLLNFMQVIVILCLFYLFRELYCFTCLQDVYFPI